jgi:hypothetical protein
VQDLDEEQEQEPQRGKSHKRPSCILPADKDAL